MSTYQVKTHVPTLTGRVRTVYVDVPCGRTLADLEPRRPLRERVRQARSTPKGGR